ncbi:MAG: hypothetical protein U0325_10350 [Polyangiales bacterium]
MSRRRTPARWLVWSAVIAAVLELTARHLLSGPFPCLTPSVDPELVFALRPGVFHADGYLERLPMTRYEIAADGCQHRGGDPALLALGSSHGFGLAVSQDEAFPEVLRRDLAARGHDLRGTRNCSVPGHTLLPQLRRAELALGDRAHPLVVVLVAQNHLRRAQDWSALAPRGSVARWFVAHVRLVRLAHLLRLQHTFESRPSPFESPARLRAGLVRFAEAARARRAVAVLGVLGRAEHPSFDLTAEATRAGLTVVPLGATPRGAVWTLDGEHWSARGHREMASRWLGGVDAALGGSAR